MGTTALVPEPVNAPRRSWFLEPLNAPPAAHVLTAVTHAIARVPAAGAAASRPGRRRRPLLPAFGLPALAAASALLLTGCGSGGPDTAPAGATSSPGATARPMTIEQLAEKVGCAAKITLKAKDYRQAACETSKGQVTFLDFQTAKGQSAWLDYAEMYGGIYLSGNRWVVTASTMPYLESLRGELGGKIEEQGGYGSSPSPSASS
jgi:hypothetical protein